MNLKTNSSNDSSIYVTDNNIHINFDNKEILSPKNETECLIPKIVDRHLDNTNGLVLKIKKSIRKIHTYKVQKDDKNFNSSNKGTSSNFENRVIKTINYKQHLSCLSNHNRNHRVKFNGQWLVTEKDSAISSTFASSRDINGNCSTRDIDSDISETIVSSSETNYSAHFKFQKDDLELDIKQENILVRENLSLSPAKSVFNQHILNSNFHFSQKASNNVLKKMFDNQTLKQKFGRIDSIAVPSGSFGYTNMSSNTQFKTNDNAQYSDGGDELEVCEAGSLCHESTETFSVNVEESQTQHLSVNVVYDDQQCAPTSFGNNFPSTDRNGTLSNDSFCEPFQSPKRYSKPGKYKKNHGHSTNSPGHNPNNDEIDGTDRHEIIEIRPEQGQSTSKSLLPTIFSGSFSQQTTNTISEIRKPHLPSTGDQLFMDLSPYLMITKENETYPLKATLRSYENDKHPAPFKAAILSNASTENISVIHNAKVLKPNPTTEDQSRPRKTNQSKDDQEPRKNNRKRNEISSKRPDRITDDNAAKKNNCASEATTSKHRNRSSEDLQSKSTGKLTLRNYENDKSAPPMKVAVFSSASEENISVKHNDKILKPTTSGEMPSRQNNRTADSKPSRSTNRPNEELQRKKIADSKPSTSTNRQSENIQPRKTPDAKPSKLTTRLSDEVQSKDTKKYNRSSEDTQSKVPVKATLRNYENDKNAPPLKVAVLSNASTENISVSHNDKRLKPTTSEEIRKNNRTPDPKQAKVTNRASADLVPRSDNRTPDPKGLKLTNRSSGEIAPRSGNRTPDPKASKLTNRSSGEIATRSDNRTPDPKATKPTTRGSGEIAPRNDNRIPDPKASKLTNRSSGEIATRSDNRTPDPRATKLTTRGSGEIAPRNDNRTPDTKASKVPNRSSGEIVPRSGNRTIDPKASKLTNRSSGEVAPRSDNRIPDPKATKLTNRGSGEIAPRSDNRTPDPKASKLTNRSSGEIAPRSDNRTPDPKASKLTNRSSGEIAPRGGNRTPEPKASKHHGSSELLPRMTSRESGETTGRQIIQQPTKPSRSNVDNQSKASTRPSYDTQSKQTNRTSGEIKPKPTGRSNNEPNAAKESAIIIKMESVESEGTTSISIGVKVAATDQNKSYEKVGVNVPNMPNDTQNVRNKEKKPKDVPREDRTPKNQVVPDKTKRTSKEAPPRKTSREVHDPKSVSESALLIKVESKESETTTSISIGVKMGAPDKPKSVDKVNKNPTKGLKDEGKKQNKENKGKEIVAKPKDKQVERMDKMTARSMSSESISLQIDFNTMGPSTPDQGSKPMRNQISINIDMKRNDGQDKEADAYKQILDSVIKALIDDGIIELGNRRKEKVAEKQTDDKDATGTRGCGFFFIPPRADKPNVCVIPVVNYPPFSCLDPKKRVECRPQPSRLYDFKCPCNLNPRRLTQSDINIPNAVTNIISANDIINGDCHSRIPCATVTQPPFEPRRSSSSANGRFGTCSRYHDNTRSVETLYVRQTDVWPQSARHNDVGIPLPYGYRKQDPCCPRPTQGVCLPDYNHQPFVAHFDRIPTPRNDCLNCTSCHTSINFKNRNEHIAKCLNANINNCNNSNDRKPTLKYVRRKSKTKPVGKKTRIGCNVCRDNLKKQANRFSKTSYIKTLDQFNDKLYQKIQLAKSKTLDVEIVKNC